MIQYSSLKSDPMTTTKKKTSVQVHGKSWRSNDAASKPIVEYEPAFKKQPSPNRIMI
jgi:hypothetical protein